MTAGDAGVADTVKSGGGFTVSVTVAVRVTPPLVPVIVKVEGPIGVVCAVVKVRGADAAPAIEDGARVAVAPAGSPLTLSATVPVNPFGAAVEPVSFPTRRSSDLGDAGVADTVKSGGGFTVSVTVAVRVTVPLVPVIVRVAGPTGVVCAVVTVSVAVPAPAIDDGANVAVAPAGSPLTLSATVPVNPFSTAVETV